MKTQYGTVALFFSALLALLLLDGCNLDLGERGNGNVITDRKETGDFQEIILRGNFDVLLRQSDEASVDITTDENLMPYITVENIGGTLEINSSRKLRPSDNSRLTINYRSVESIEVQGSASLETDRMLSGDYLKLTMSGAGAVEMDVDLGRLELDISGAGAVKLRGNADEQVISMSGAGGYEAGQLESRSCRILISGVGGAEVYVTQDLDATVSGIGGVSYSGNPVNVRSDVSGLGSVSEDGEDRNL